jgi:hypothetical protein
VPFNVGSGERSVAGLQAFAGDREPSGDDYKFALSSGRI